MTRNRQETPAEAMERLRRKIRVEYAEKAVNGLVKLCEDEKTPPTARTAAGIAILRAAGLFDQTDDDLDEKEPHEMSWDELNRAVKRSERLRRLRDGDAEDGEEGVFE